MTNVQVRWESSETPEKTTGSFPLLNCVFGLLAISTMISSTRFNFTLGLKAIPIYDEAYGVAQRPKVAL